MNLKTLYVTLHMRLGTPGAAEKMKIETSIERLLLTAVTSR